MPLARDLLQPVPECILETHARFVASDHDRALDDPRFHEDTPNCPSFDGIAFSAMTRFRSGWHSPPIDPTFGSGVAPRPEQLAALTFHPLLRFRQHCGSVLTSSASVTRLPHTAT